MVKAADARLRFASILALVVGIVVFIASGVEGLDDSDDANCLLQESLKSYATLKLDVPRAGAINQEDSMLMTLYSFIPGLSAPPKLPSHPFPSVEWQAIRYPAVLYCSLSLFMAGILCAAGGIGGGGVYVTVLLVMGQLSPHDAVPLSKAIVFCGSLSSLVLNLTKTMKGSSIVDFNICRLVVPAALCGTLIGVILNSLFAPWLIVASLVMILVAMTFMVCHKWYEQYLEECAPKPLNPQDSENDAEKESAKCGNPSCGAPFLGDNSKFCNKCGTKRPEPQEEERPQGTQEVVCSCGTVFVDEHSMFCRKCGAKRPERTQESKPQSESVAQLMGGQSMKGIMLCGEGFGAAALLLLTIACGALRHHVVACERDLLSDPDNAYGRGMCERPVTHAFFGSLASWVAPHSPSLIFLKYGTLLLPMALHTCVFSCYTSCLIKSEGWHLNQVLSYMSMGVFTGCFAGLVGIGGGLVFSPFLLWMAVEPSMAVATSSTLVIFTSSSTTFQYLLTDRIVLSLTVVYGLINLVASYLGTSVVHALHDKCHARKSLITGIVALGVIASVILSVYKLFHMGVAHAR